MERGPDKARRENSRRRESCMPFGMSFEGLDHGSQPCPAAGTWLKNGISYGFAISKGFHDSSSNEIDFIFPWGPSSR